MRKGAIVLIVAWVAVAYGFRYYDHRPLGTQVFAHVAAQGGPWAHIAWIEGPTRLADHGHLVVARVRVDRIPSRHASVPVPGDPRECRLWFEESPDAVQAVALCAGFRPIRLTADGKTLPPMGPLTRSAPVHTLYPLKSFDPQPVIQSIRPHDPSQPHPVLAALALVAFVPLLVAGVRELRRARAVEQQPPGETEIPGEPARRVRRAARRDLVIAIAGLAIALVLSAGRV